MKLGLILTSLVFLATTQSTEAAKPAAAIVKAVSTQPVKELKSAGLEIKELRFKEGEFVAEPLNEQLDEFLSGETHIITENADDGLVIVQNSFSRVVPHLLHSPYHGVLCHFDGENILFYSDKTLEEVHNWTAQDIKIVDKIVFFRLPEMKYYYLIRNNQEHRSFEELRTRYPAVTASISPDEFKNA